MINMLLAGIIVLTYVFIMIIKTKSIPSSISETYYLGGGNWFSIVMFITSFLMTIGMLNLTENSNWQFLSFLTGGSLLFVGCAPQFHENFVKTVHYCGAFTLLIGSQIWIIIFSSPYVLLTWLLGIFWFKTEEKVFWIEMTCIINLLLSLIFI